MNPNQEKIDFSIVIPLYNKVSYIDEALNSIFSQRFSRFEIIVVDDGSTDGSRESVLAHQDSRVKLLEKKNGGPSSARNMGIKEAKSDLVVFLDGDDFWHCEFLSELHKLVEACPDAALYGLGYELQYPTGNRRAPRVGLRPNYFGYFDYFLAASVGDSPLSMSSIAVRKKLALEVGGFSEHYCIGEDGEFFCKIFLKAPAAYSNKKLAVYRQEVTASQMAIAQTLKAKDIYLDPTPELLHQFLKQNKIPHHLQRSAEIYLESWAINFAKKCLLNLEQREALKILSVLSTNHNCRYILALQVICRLPSWLWSCFLSAYNFSKWIRTRLSSYITKLS